MEIGLVLIGSGTNPVAAQELKPAVFGLGIEWKRLGLDAEVQRTLGLTPRAVQCGLVNVPCVGSAREGLLEATMLSDGTERDLTLRKRLTTQPGEAGYAAKDIEYLAFSHYHYDHTANANAFAGATWLVRRRGGTVVEHRVDQEAPVGRDTDREAYARPGD